jgi:hypothetical protein
MSAPGSGDDFQFTGVMLEALNGTAVTTVPDLAIGVGAAGITIHASGRPPSRIEWGQLAEAHCTDPGLMPDGQPATALSMVVVGRPTRLLIPNSQIPPVMAGQLNLLLMGYTGSNVPSPVLPATMATPAPTTAPPELTVHDDVPSGAPAHESPPSSPRQPQHAAPEPPLVERQPQHAAPPSPLDQAEPRLDTLPPPPPGAVPLAPGVVSAAAFTPTSPGPDLNGPFTPAPPAYASAPPVFTPAPPVYASVPPNGPPPVPPPLPPSGFGPQLTAPVPEPPYAGYAAAGWPPPPPEPKKKSKTLLYLIIGLVVVLVAGAVAIPLSLGHTKKADTPTTSQRQHQRQAALGTADQQVARQVNIALPDLPAAPPWAIDSSEDAALNAFLQTDDNAKPTPAEAKEEKQVATQFESCMGIAADNDREFGNASSIPTTTVASPVFAEAAPSKAETGSETEVFSTAAPVQADGAQVSNPKFPSCLGAALGTLLSEAFGQGAVTTGTPSVQPIAMSDISGLNPVGTNITIPVTENGTTTNLEYGFVMVYSGKVEATLLTFNTPTPFSTVLQLQLIRTLAENVSKVANSSGA